jgi:hypothetical protein
VIPALIGVSVVFVLSGLVAICAIFGAAKLRRHRNGSNGKGGPS